MTSWFKKINIQKRWLPVSLIGLPQAALAGPLAQQITAAIETPILGALVVGACAIMGLLKAFDIWKSVFGGSGGDIWKDVAALLGWIVLALYWKQLIQLLLQAFSGI
jgi:hypothetical protein